MTDLTSCHCWSQPTAQSRHSATTAGGFGPNIVVGGVPGLAERAWEGHALKIGDVLIGIDSLRGRCVMTTFDPDSLQQDRRVLKKIVDQFDGRLALNCWVIQGGTIRIGEEVELIQPLTSATTGVPA